MPASPVRTVLRFYGITVSQLSEQLRLSLMLTGVANTLLQWFSVSPGGQYTCRVTSWPGHATPQARALLFASLAQIMAAAIGGAAKARHLIFAGASVAMLFRRTGFIVWSLRPAHLRAVNQHLTLGWLLIAGILASPVGETLS